MTFLDMEVQRSSNPVDTVEQLAQLREWCFDRYGDDEISITVSGRFTDYNLSFTWHDELESLHLACAFDLRVPERRKAEVIALIAKINEQLWLGHFDFWSEEGVVMYRHGLLLNGGAEASEAQCEALLRAASEACERYYQAFQFVVWAGRDAREALEYVAFDTVGEA
jgi:hypothetical protein